MALSIYIRVSSTEWKPGSRLIKGTEYEDLLSEFSKYIANIYAKQIVDAINTQRYSGSWEPLSKEYLEFKRKNNLSTKTWEATELLKNSIGVWRLKDHYVVGVKRNVVYPGSNVPVYKVIRCLEFGTSKMPARPLFMPIKRSISGNIRNYWNRFLEERGYNE